MSFEYSVQLNDPTNAGGSADSVLVYDLEQALGVYSEYISGLGNLVVALNIVNTPQGREDGGPTSSSLIGTSSTGLSIYEPSSEYELKTGNHVAGTASDITINISPGYLTNLDLAPNLTFDSQVPANEYDPINIFLHELTHGLGQSGWYSQSGVLPGRYESNFDALIQQTQSGAYFIGANAEAAYGGPVPITTDSTSGENYYHFGNTQSDLFASPSTVQDPLTLDLMNGIVFFYDYSYFPSKLDLGVLEDLGYNINSSPNFGPAGYETVFAGGGNISFAGDGNHDTAIFHGISSQYSIAESGQTLTTTDSVVGRDAVDTFSNVEFLQFIDKTVFVENSDNANIARLYSAAFNRTPDVTGLIFWENVYSSSVPASAKAAGYYTALAQTDDGSGTSIAANFMQSSEFISTYGSLTDAQFVTLLYQNVLGRAPDQAGLNFWVGELEGVNPISRATALVGFAESPENVAKTSTWLIAT